MEELQTAANLTSITRMHQLRQPACCLIIIHYIHLLSFKACNTEYFITAGSNQGGLCLCIPGGDAVPLPVPIGEGKCEGCCGHGTEAPPGQTAACLEPSQQVSMGRGLCCAYFRPAHTA